MEKKLKKLIETIHKYILQKIKPDITFLLKVKVAKHLADLKKEKLKIGMINFQKIFIKMPKKLL